MMKMFAKRESNGEEHELVQLGPEEFAVQQRELASVVGHPVFWCKDKGVLPTKPAGEVWLFRTEEKTDDLPETVAEEVLPPATETEQ